MVSGQNERFVFSLIRKLMLNTNSFETTCINKIKNSYLINLRYNMRFSIELKEKSRVKFQRSRQTTNREPVVNR